MTTLDWLIIFLYFCGLGALTTYVVRRGKETIDRKSPIRDTLANPVNVTSELVYKKS